MGETITVGMSENISSNSITSSKGRPLIRLSVSLWVAEARLAIFLLLGLGVRPTGRPVIMARWPVARPISFGTMRMTERMSQVNLHRNTIALQGNRPFATPMPLQVGAGMSPMSLQVGAGMSRAGA